MENAYGNWILVVISSVIFLAFLKSSFKPKTKTDWRTYNMLAAFIVSLFVEMYGFPLTIYLLTSWLGNKFLNLDLSHNAGHLLNTLLGLKGDPHFSLPHIISNILIVAGLIIISVAWDTLYKAQKNKKLATEGIYEHVRHPQYTGFIAIIVGFLLQWPTLITLLMAPILIIRYIKLAKKEESSMVSEYGVEYINYKSKTPAFFPSLSKILTDKTFKLSK